MSETKNPPTAKKPVATDPDSFLQRAMKGDASTLPMLRNMLTQQPETVNMLGNLASQTELSLINGAAGDNLAFKESLPRKMRSLRDELAGPNPTPLEKLLVERIALCWLSLYLTELRLSQFTNPTIAQADHWQRKIDHAHRRYLTAIKTLATIRKLAMPVVQVNIAKRQTNIAGAVPVPQTEKEAE